MNRRLTTWCCWLLAGVFGGLSGGGQGLHLLPGLGHRAERLPSACCDASCGGYGNRQAAEPRAGFSGPTFAAAKMDRAPAACAICQFFASAKGVAASAPVLATAVSAAEPIPDAPTAPLAAAVPYHCRAPPVGRSIM